MSRFRCDGCAAPNFAYALCTSRSKVPVRLLEGLDLGAWRVAFNGAETVHPATVDAFVDRFAAFGFDRRAVYPAYGLAENVVACCFPEVGRGPRVEHVERESLERERLAVPLLEATDRTRSVISVGKPLVGQRVRVVSDARGPVAERVVGHIQISGRCVMKGYRGRPVDSAAVLRPDGWLETGDLGYLADGELYVVGRHKEVIKKNGARYDASDMQRVIASVEGARPGGAAVFGVPDSSKGTERIVAMLETRLGARDELQALRAEISREVRRVFSTSIDEILFVEPGVLLKSTSGKVRNEACKELYLSESVASLEGGCGT